MGYYAVESGDAPAVLADGGLQLPAVIFVGARNMRI
jgi:hypothetical protein